MQTIRPVPQAASSEVVLTARRFHVERRTFRRSAAEPLVREYVVHPGAVVILPLLDGGRIVMNRQVRRGVETELLELPAGTLEQGEAPVETARRELEEETGYRPGRLEPLAEFFTSPGFITERMHAFVATELVAAKQNLDDGEQIEVEIVPLDEVRRMLTQGELHDAKTIAVLGIYFLRRQ